MRTILSLTVSLALTAGFLFPPPSDSFLDNDNTKARATNALQCYPAKSCYGSRPGINIPIGKSITKNIYISRNEIVTRVINGRDSSFSEYLLTTAAGIPNFYIGAATGFILYQANQSVQRQKNQMLKWSQDRKLKGMVARVVIGRTYTGYTVSVVFMPWR